MPFAAAHAAAVEQQDAQAFPHAGHRAKPCHPPPRRNKGLPGQGIYGFDESPQVSGSLI
ncbi:MULTISPECIES: hypothetical protein [Ralstonia solanacearum species complex]|uniref:hypothetical protein n=1 Tax=Ralstonia solanacearum species complex TaxID=3116862 RepID=UPI0002D52895|nr:hypothetical protein [Ralstonia solanacearum]